MRDREYRDPNFRLVGKVRERPDGRREARDPNTGSLLGTYDPDRDETCDPNGSLIGRGDFLSRLFRW